MKFLLFNFLFILGFTSLFSQNIQVFDAQNHPVENVVVLGDNFSGYTNANGIVQNFPADGSIYLIFVHPNFKRLTLSWDQLVQMNFNVVLEQKLHLLNEVTIRPMKRAQLLNETPQKVSTITQQTVQFQQPQTTADLLGASGEVFIQKSQMGGGSPMLRGFSANRILLVVDGVRMNNAIYRSGNLHNVISLDASGLEQTEIILGPGSVVYGSDALGGVIHFYTLKPKLSTTELKTPVNVMVRTSSANFEKTGHLNFNLSGEQWASLTSITFSDFDDLLMGSRLFSEYTRPHYVETIQGEDRIKENTNPDKQIFTGYSQFNLIQKVRFRPSNKADFEYAFHYSNSTNIPRYDRLIQYSGETLKYAEWYYGPQKWMMHTLKSELNINNKVVNNITFLAAYQNYTESRHDRRFQKPELFSRTEHVDMLSLNIDADKYFTKTQSLYYGIEGIYNLVHSSGIETNINDQSISQIASRYPDGSTWRSWAAYAMYQQVLNGKTSLQTGVRYNFTGMKGTFDQTYYNLPFDDFNDSNGALSVSFGMVFNLAESSRISSNASTGFRSPNIDDAAKVFDSEPGNVIVPNPNLEPEYASSFETGYQWNKEKIQFNLNVFYTRLYNAMVRRNGQLNGQDSILYDGQMSKVKMMTNASWANIAGISSDIHYKINQHFKLKSSINWQTGTDSDDLPVRHVAPLFGNFHVEYQNQKLEFDTYILFNGKIDFEDLAPEEREKPEMYATNSAGLPYSPSWWTLNLKAGYQLSQTIKINTGIENILDVRYRPYSSGIVAPGMNFILSLLINLNPK